MKVVFQCEYQMHLYNAKCHNLTVSANAWRCMIVANSIVKLSTTVFLLNFSDKEKSFFLPHSRFGHLTFHPHPLFVHFR